MRILHTSDWHLGRTLHGVSLATAQQQAVDAIIELAIGRSVDVVVVAGDVFDRAVPPIEALRLLNEAILRLDDAGIITIMTAGNHDSGERLATYAGVLRDTVHLVGGLDKVGSSIELADEYGTVHFYALPYLEPDFARVSLGEGEVIERSHSAVMAAALDRIARNRALDSGARAVLIGHAFVADVEVAAQTSESERDLTVGGVAIVPATLLADHGFDYVALGHLHRPQRVNSGESIIRYSGSLLRYSFSEADHTKSCVLVELEGPGTSPTVELVPIPQPRGMLRLRGMIDDLLSDAHASAREDFVELTITDPLYPDRMHARLDAVFPYALRKEHVPEGRVFDSASAPVRTQGRQPVDVMVEFLSRMSGEPVGDDEVEIVREAFEAVRDRAL